MTGHEPVILPQKRPFESVYTLQVDSSNIERTSPWTDVSPDIGYGPQQQAYFRAYAATQQRATDVQNTGKDGNESATTAPSDSEGEQQATTTQHNASHDKRPNNSTGNFPGVRLWRCQRPTFRSSWPPLKKKQAPGASGDLSNHSLKKKSLRSSQTPRRRILMSRAAYRDKNRGQG